MAERLTGRPKSEILRRVLRWWSRGVGDSDSVDTFVDFWVALEALADSYEGNNVQPQTCECGRLIKSRPINGVLRAYLRFLGMNDDAELISKLSSARADLIHYALSEEALKYLPEVSRILKTCIQKEVDGT